MVIEQHAIEQLMDKIKKYLEVNQNKLNQNLWDVAKAILKEVYSDINFIKQKECPQINNFNPQDTIKRK